MPKIIFVTGLSKSGYGTILDMVLEGSKKRLGRHIRIGFEERELDKAKRMIAPDTRKTVTGLYKSIENQISAALKSGVNVVVDGPLTLSTEEGYLPLMPKRFFESFKPEVFLVFEATRTEARKGGSGIDWTQQEMNRSYAAMYASLGGSLLKIIPIGRGGVKDALRDCTHMLEYFLA